MSRALSFLLILAPLCALALVLGYDSELSAAFFNADAVFAPALYRDLVIDGGALRAWSFPPPGFFFPDLFFYTILRAITGDFVAATYAFAAVQFLFFYGGLQYLGLTLVDAGDASGRRTILHGGAVAALLSLVFCASAGAPALGLLFQMTHHTGAFVIALWAAGFLMRGRVWLLGGLVFLGVFSDVLFLGFFVVPAVLACVFVGTPTKTPTKVTPAGRFVGTPADGVSRNQTRLVLGAATVAGLVAFDRLKNVGTLLLPNVPVELANIVSGQHLYAVLTAGLQLVASHVSAVGTPTILFLLLYCAGIAMILIGLVKDRGGGHWFAAYAATAVLICCGLALGGALVQNQNEPAARYMLPALLLPIIAICWFVALRLENRPGILTAGVTLLSAVLLITGQTRGNSSTVDAMAQGAVHPGSIAACIHEQAPGLRDGLAGYALAKPVDLFRRSRGTPYRINQIEATGQPRFWMNSAAWYGDGTRDQAPVYDFILTAGFAEERLRASFDRPARRFDCPGTQVWVYAAPIQAHDINQVRMWRALIGR